MPQLNIRVSEEEKSAWTAKAEAAGLSLSEWIRSLANGREGVLARQAHAVMLRRSDWHVRESRGAWVVCWNHETAPHVGHIEDGTWEDPGVWPCPFQALVEADKWYREHVEGE